MSEQVAARDLRNHTAGLLERAEGGERIVITRRGQPVAELGPVNTSHRWLTRGELLRRLASAQADAGLRDDLARLAGETTDDLGPLT
jgi:prevent-host-death family protein